MNLPVAVTILVDNVAAGRDLLAEHGLSLLVEAGDHTVLFDTGQGLALPHNARRLGLRPGDLDAVAISHGHYDHTGGLPFVLEDLPGTAGLYLHPTALEPRDARNAAGTSRSIGMPPAARRAVATWSGRLEHTSGPRQVVPGVWMTGPIPRATAIEDTGGPFFLDRACTRPDPIEDDCALLIESASGWVVLLGCAHAGVIHTLDFVADHFGADRIHAVIGGMHLLHATPERLAATARALEDRCVHVLAPLHCTGTAAAAWLWSRLPGCCQPAGVGSRFEFTHP